MTIYSTIIKVQYFTFNIRAKRCVLHTSNEHAIISENGIILMRNANAQNYITLEIFMSKVSTWF